MPSAFLLIQSMKNLFLKNFFQLSSRNSWKLYSLRYIALVCIFMMTFSNYNPRVDKSKNPKKAKYGSCFTDKKVCCFTNRHLIACVKCFFWNFFKWNLLEYVLSLDISQLYRHYSNPIRNLPVSKASSYGTILFWKRKRYLV